MRRETARAVKVLIQTAFVQYGGKGDAEPYVIREPKRMQQQSLFAIPESRQPTPLQKRHKAAKAVYDRAVEAWKIRYRQFVLDYADRATEPFSAEDTRLAYLADPRNPRTPSEQASGEVFKQLRKDKLIKLAGSKRSKKFGNLLSTYVKA